jgi:predicted RNA-binding protein with PUA-like domain
MSYWIFKVNPDLYRIDQRLHDPDPQTSWRVTRYRAEVKKGDVAFIWRAGARRGICGVMQVQTDPAKMEELEAEQKYHARRDDKIIVRVLGTLTQRFDCISSTALKNIPGLENLTVLKPKEVFPRATNFKVTDKEGEILMRAVEVRCGRERSL